MNFFSITLTEPTSLLTLEVLATVASWLAYGGDC